MRVPYLLLLYLQSLHLLHCADAITFFISMAAHEVQDRLLEVSNRVSRENLAGALPRRLLQTHNLFALDQSLLISSNTSLEAGEGLLSIEVSVHGEGRLLIGGEGPDVLVLIGWGRSEQQQRRLGQVEGLAGLRVIQILLLVVGVRTHH